MDTWISDTKIFQLTWKLKKIFVLYVSITWIMNYGIQGNNRILTITRITWITRFPFISCLDQFCLYFPKSSVNEIPTQTQVRKSETYNYVIKSTSGLCEWMNGSSSVTQWLGQLDHQSSFIWVSISRITDPFFQTNSP